MPSVRRKVARWCEEKADKSVGNRAKRHWQTPTERAAMRRRHGLPESLSMLSSLHNTDRSDLVISVLKGLYQQTAEVPEADRASGLNLLYLEVNGDG